MNVNEYTVTALYCVLLCVCGPLCNQIVLERGVERQIAVLKVVTPESFGKNAV
jgi:hypothetical protein